ncbi:MAG: SDR family oxidoreductase [Hyphomicrobiales bacterium]
MRIDNNTILITGGSSGIGEVLAVHLQEVGNTIIAVGRDPEKLAMLQTTYPQIETRVCDISNDDQVCELRDEFGGRVNILINNASIHQEVSLCNDSDLQSQLDQIDINLGGTLRMIHYFLPCLREKPTAAIVNVTSALAYVTEAKSPIYSATKAAQHSLTMSLRHQLAPSKIKVFELIPPLTDTPMAAHITNIPKLAPDKLAKALINGLKKDRIEIAPGLSGITRIMARLAPRFTFSKLNANPS